MRRTMGRKRKPNVLKNASTPNETTRTSLNNENSAVNNEDSELQRADGEDELAGFEGNAPANFNGPTNDTLSLERLRIAVERHAASADEIVGLDVPAAQLREKVKLMEKMFDRYMDEYTRIMRDMDPGHKLPEGVPDEVEEVETAYLTAVSLIQGRIEELSGENSPHPKEPTTVPNTSAGGQDINLERIKPPKFHGNYAMWNEWRAMFDSLVHNNHQIHPTQKFHYLKNCTVGDAAKVLQGWLVVGTNYQNAYDALVELYENKYRIVLAHLEELTGMKVQENESYHGLREMIDTVNRSLRQLKAIGTPVDYWDHIIIHLMLQRVSPKTRSEWENQHDLTEMPTLKDAMKFMERRARSIINVSADVSAAGRTEPNLAEASIAGTSKSAAKQTGSGTAQRLPPTRIQNYETGNQVSNVNLASHPIATVEQRRGIECYNCGQPHPMYRCEQILRLGPNERMTKIRSMNLCLNCLSPNHPTGGVSCKFGPCRRCNNGSVHNSILCPTLQQQYQQEQTQVQGRSRVNAMNTGSTENTEHEATSQNPGF